jgi:predicted nucleic acid-binding protein
MKGRILIDTNLLILLAVGIYDRAYISSHKRCSSFDADDFDLLMILLEGQQLVVTTHVLTEASNLLWQTSEPHSSKIRDTLREIVETTMELSEVSSKVMNTSKFMKLGLTDAAILTMSEKSLQILTVDLDLHIAALELELETENFNNYRAI